MNNIVTDNWAEALLQVSIEANKLKKIFFDLNLFSELLHNNENLVAFLSSSYFEKVDKHNFIDSIFSHLSEEILNFIHLIIEKNMARNIVNFFLVSIKRFFKSLNIKEVKVFSARPLSKDNIESIKKVLEKKTNSELILVNSVDESLIGGLKIDLDDQSIDNTIKSKLERMKLDISSTR